MQGRVFHWCYYCLNGGSEYPVYCKQNHWFCAKDCPVCADCPICAKYAKPGKREKHSDKHHHKWECLFKKEFFLLLLIVLFLLLLLHFFFLFFTDRARLTLGVWGT